MIRLRFDMKLISKDNEKIAGRGGRYFLSRKFKMFEERIRLLAKQQYRGEILAGDVSCKLVASFKDKRHADCTNLFKGVCDALQGICYNNDRQIKYAECIVVDDASSDFFIVMVDEKI